MPRTSGTGLKWIGVCLQICHDTKKALHSKLAMFAFDKASLSFIYEPFLIPCFVGKYAATCSRKSWKGKIKKKISKLHCLKKGA